MAECTEAERKMLDEMSYTSFEEVAYDVAMRKAGPEFFEALVQAFIECERAIQRAEHRRSLFDKANSFGFTGGNNGGIVRLWNAAETEAKKRMGTK